MYLSEDKIALFDFCDTMINFQSADAYVRYVKDNVPHSVRMNFLETLRGLLVKSGGMMILQRLSREGYVNKRMLLQELNGLDESIMNDLAEKFYREKIRPNYVPEVIDALKRHKAEGYRMFIVSGGYDIYLKYVASEFGFEKVIATCLEFQNGRFTGHYKGDDCMKVHKVDLLRNYFGRDDLKDCDSVAYSDSASDIPMMKLCRRGVAVLRNNTPPQLS